MQKKIEFSCGILIFDPLNNRVNPDKSKGKIILELNEDNEIKFQWVNQGGEIGNERYLFSNDAVFEKVRGQKRVYLLRFQTDSDKYFFWMQSKDSSEDEVNCKQFNDLLNSQFKDFMLEEEQLKQQQPQQQQPLQQQPIQQQPLQQQPQSNQSYQSSQNQFSQESMQMLLASFNRGPQLSLNDVLNQDYLKTCAYDPDYLNRIIDLLPDGQKDTSYALENLISPQFQQAVESLECALRNQERSVLLALELDASILEKQSDGVLAFLQAIRKKVEEEEEKH